MFFLTDDHRVAPPGGHDVHMLTSVTELAVVKLTISRHLGLSLPRTHAHGVKQPICLLCVYLSVCLLLPRKSPDVNM